MKEVITALEKRNMNGYFVAGKEEALNKALELIPSGSSVGFGGSVTLEQVGILDKLRQRQDITLLDRTKIKDPEEKHQLYLKMLTCDIFLSSANAITESGKIINVDGIGNRVGAITFGPKKVIIIAGKNKITKDYNSAIERIKKVATPKNLERLKVRPNNKWTAENMWSVLTVIERQVDENRFHVIIVDEELGF